ncbi:hypothetical protein C2845_PM02G39160 [Panicum miliaceum]|uniref:Uncharacterized protein n=1 Tax=Panicum miliaceum TaxID=4540 RepID=A0A3L6SGP4_PANMI|nr:hypothetical protein C2845_PM02G39160 [Panicum miliaceum]
MDFKPILLNTAIPPNPIGIGFRRTSAPPTMPPWLLPNPHGRAPYHRTPPSPPRAAVAEVLSYSSSLLEYPNPNEGARPMREGRRRQRPPPRRDARGGGTAIGPRRLRVTPLRVAVARLEDPRRRRVTPPLPYRDVSAGT